MVYRRGLVQLEGLTERIVPAVSIRSVDGDLVISGIANTDAGVQKLWVNVTNNNQVTIQDGGSAFGTGGKPRGVYSVTGDLIFNLSNRKDQVTIDFTGAFTLDGSITATMLNGNDTFTITNSGEENSGIFGSLTVDGGNGIDTLNVTNDGTGSTMTIQGGLSFNGGAGDDAANINATGAADLLEIGSGLTLTRVNTVNVATTQDVNISGNLTINASADKLISNTIKIGTGNTVNVAGAFSITGGQGKDTVTIQNTNVVDVVPAEDEVLEITINLDRGVNETKLIDIEFGMSGTDADFAYTGGTGDDEITFSGTNTISGDAVFVLGNGSNDISVTDTLTCDSDVTITGGKMDDSVDLDAATVSGLLTLTLGNGINELISSGTIDGGLTYTGGSNHDTITLSNGDDLAGDVSISTGAGEDIVTISVTTAVAVTSLTVDLGIDSASDTLTYDSLFDALITILNQGSGDTVTSA
jgi:hypothetical protein